MIFGGAYQGKKEFALEKFNRKEEEVLDLRKSLVSAGKLNLLETAFDRKIINGMEAYVLGLVKAGEIPSAVIRSRIPELADKIVISDDVSQGIVPMDPVERAFREECGRSLVTLTQAADQVYRVFCGMAERLK